MIACYTRVSSSTQRTDSQRSIIEAWLHTQGHDPQKVSWYEDRAAPGNEMDRPELRRLRSGIDDGRIKTVVVYRVDRLARSMLHGLNLMAEWANKGVRFVSVTQNIDFSGTVGRLIASVFLAVAELERDAIRERQAAGIAVARERGRYKGAASPGHRNGPEAQRRRERRKRAAELRGQGLKIKEIAVALDCCETTVKSMLRKARGTDADA